MFSLYGPSGRSRVPALVVGGAALLVAGVAVGITIGNSDTPAPVDTADPGAAAPSAPTAESVDPDAGLDEGDPPTGCLGGPDRTAQAVLDAQARAPRSAFGAVELAATYLQFSYQFPFPSSDEAVEVQAVASESAPDAFRDLAATYEEYGDQIAPPGLEGTETPFHLTTEGGRWLVEETSTTDRVTVHVSEPYVVNDEVSQWSAYGTFVVVWEDDAWHIETVQSADTDALDAAGTTFTEGC